MLAIVQREYTVPAHHCLDRAHIRQTINIILIIKILEMDSHNWDVTPVSIGIISNNQTPPSMSIWQVPVLGINAKMICFYESAVALQRK